MKRTLFLLIFYFCLTITVGKQVRTLYYKLLAGKSFTSQTISLDFSQSEAESEETDSEDSEEGGEDNNEHELTTHQDLCVVESRSFSNYPTTPFFKDHLQEIGTPPPRF
jgi:hypothetical protein